MTELSPCCHRPFRTTAPDQSGQTRRRTRRKAATWKRRHRSDSHSRRRAAGRRRWRWAALLAVLVASGWAWRRAAAGPPQASSSSRTRVAGFASGFELVERVELATRALEYAQCMRSHGVTNFPDPTVSAERHWPVQHHTSSGINPNSPTFQAASRACQKYRPRRQLGRDQQPQHEAKRLKFAECMRIPWREPDFPDPSSNGVIQLRHGLGASTSQSSTSSRQPTRRVPDPLPAAAEAEGRLMEPESPPITVPRRQPPERPVTEEAPLTARHAVARPVERRRRRRRG